ncbi:carbohydrate ABC transporter permease [Ruminococcus sp. 5_1_39BFAA]|uniref:carbohydrate ABC transporter permease n=1 Tax=Ruminococcus sp. 5_1_39BFAA TaxID=457412 RepID=UPI00356B423C
MIEKKSSRYIQKIVFNGVFIFLAVVCVFPLLLIVSAAFTEETSLAIEGYKLWPSKFSLDAFSYILQSPKQILMSYGVTIFVTVVGTIGGLLTTSMLAYVIARKDFKFSGILSFLVFFTLLFNGGMVPSYIMIAKYYHLKDTIWALILPYIVIPWHVFLMKGFFADIPMSLVDAAKMDGAGEIRVFFNIIVPVSKPAFATIGLLTAFTYWNDWWLSMLYIDDAKLTSLQYYLYRIMNNIQFLTTSMQAGNISIDISNMPNETARMALCLLAAGPMLVIFPFFQKYFVKGLTVGAVKE